MRFKVTIEQLANNRVRCDLEQAAKAETLDAVYADLRLRFPGWFVYKGGSHVALHVDDRSERFAIIEEVK